MSTRRRPPNEYLSERIEQIRAFAEQDKMAVKQQGNSFVLRLTKEATKQYLEDLQKTLAWYNQSQEIEKLESKAFEEKILTEMVKLDATPSIREEEKEVIIKSENGIEAPTGQIGPDVTDA